MEFSRYLGAGQETAYRSKTLDFDVHAEPIFAVGKDSNNDKNEDGL